MSKTIVGAAPFAVTLPDGSTLAPGEIRDAGKNDITQLLADGHVTVVDSPERTPRALVAPESKETE